MDSATCSLLTPPTPSWASARAATSWATTWKKSFPRYPRAPESTRELSRVPESTRECLSVSLARARCTAAVSRHGVQQALPPGNDREARRRCAAASGRCLALTVRRPSAASARRVLKPVVTGCELVLRRNMLSGVATYGCISTMYGSNAPRLPLVPKMHLAPSPRYLTCT